jgi:hypothetical protein
LAWARAIVRGTIALFGAASALAFLDCVAWPFEQMELPVVATDVALLTVFRLQRPLTSPASVNSTAPCSLRRTTDALASRLLVVVGEHDQMRPPGMIVPSAGRRPGRQPTERTNE